MLMLGLGGLCSKTRALCYAPCFRLLSYYALGWVILCSIDRLLCLDWLVINFQYTLLTDIKLPCDTCVHVLSLYLSLFVDKSASCGSTVIVSKVCQNLKSCH